MEVDAVGVGLVRGCSRLLCVDKISEDKKSIKSFRTLHRNDFLTASPGVFKVRCEPLGEVQHPHGVKKQFVVVGYPSLCTRSVVSSKHRGKKW